MDRPLLDPWLSGVVDEAVAAFGAVPAVKLMLRGFLLLPNSRSDSISPDFTFARRARTHVTKASSTFSPVSADVSIKWRSLSWAKALASQWVTCPSVSCKVFYWHKWPNGEAPIVCIRSWESENIFVILSHTPAVSTRDAHIAGEHLKSWLCSHSSQRHGKDLF